MRYEGPIYRPPSEADSLLIQATVGCPHNRCTFCMVYKNGPRFRVRPVAEIKADLDTARDQYGPSVRRLFLPAGNTIAVKTDDLCAVCDYARRQFPDLDRITVYGSAQYICRHGLPGLRRLAAAGLSRIHMGLESGDERTLRQIRKGSTRSQQIEAGRQVLAAGMELSAYVLLGIAGAERSAGHARATATALNAIDPHFIRLRTFVPKRNTPLLEDVQSGRFAMMGPHAILAETAAIVEGLTTTGRLTSDHYTNYINLEGRLPDDRPQMLAALRQALQRPESFFRPFFVGTQ